MPKTNSKNALNKDLIERYRKELVALNDDINRMPDGYHKKDCIRHYYRVARKLMRLERKENLGGLKND